MKIDTIYSKKIDIEVHALENPETSRKALWAVVASNSDGHRFQHEHLFASEREADAFAQKILDAKELSGDGWTVTTPIYGSPAYWENPYSD